jgi:hypothetical protein
MSLAEWIAVLASVLALLGQGVNVYLHLRIRNAILESERGTMDRVEKRLEHFVPLEVCLAKMPALKTRRAS